MQGAEKQESKRDAPHWSLIECSPVSPLRSPVAGSVKWNETHH